MKKRLISFIISLTVILMSAGFTTTTFARENIGDARPTYNYRVINGVSIGYTYSSYFRSKTGRSGNYKSSLTLSISETKLTEHAYNSTFTVKVGSKNVSFAIKSAFGFKKNESRSLSSSYTIKIPKYKRGEIKVRTKYKTYKGTLQRQYITDFGKTFWVTDEDETVFAREPVAFDFSSRVW